MKKKGELITKLRFILVVVLVPVLFQSCSLTKMMFVESESQYNYTKTIEMLEKSLTDNGWSVSHVTDLQEYYQKYGETNQMTTMEICLPAEAVKILADGDRKRMLPMIPMRVAVYEKDNGQVYVSRMRLKMMKKMTGGQLKKMMKQRDCSEIT